MNAVVLPMAAALRMGRALAQHPVQPSQKWEATLATTACRPGAVSPRRDLEIERSGNSCPLGFYASGNYCVSSPNNNRKAIQKQGNSCPLGWFSSGSYCVKNN